MGFDGIYRLADPPMSGEQVRVLQSKARRGFGSYAVPLGVVVNGLYDAATAAFVAEYQARKNRDGYRPTLPANPTAELGDCDYATKIALGLIAAAVVTPKPPPAVAYTVAGTWAGWNDGPPAWTAWRLDPKRFFQQGVDYPAMGFLSPDPSVSYNESRDAGVGELLRLALPDPRPKVPIGYSQGADVVTRFLHAWPAERRDEIRAVIKFGDPGHLPGTQGSVNGGIARFYTPDWCAARTVSYLLPGDMYGDAPGLLPFLYDVLTRMDMSVEFMGFMFTMLTGIPLSLGGVMGSLGGLLGGGLGGLLGGAAAPSGVPSLIGGQLLGLGSAGSSLPGFGSIAGVLGLVTPGPVTQVSGPISLAAMLLNIPAIVQTLIAALKFVFTNAHMKYGGAGSTPAFEGVDAVIHAASVVNRLTI